MYLGQHIGPYTPKVASILEDGINLSTKDRLYWEIYVSLYDDTCFDLEQPIRRNLRFQIEKL